MKQMKTDAYTKIVLTVIAVCLVCLVLKTPAPGTLVSTAQAEDYSGRRVTDVNIVSIDGKTFNPLQVAIDRPALPVQNTGK